MYNSMVCIPYGYYKSFLFNHGLKCYVGRAINKLGISCHDRAVKYYAGFNAKVLCLNDSTSNMKIRTYAEKPVDNSGDYDNESGVGSEKLKEKELIEQSGIETKGLKLVASNQSAIEKLSLFSKYNMLSEFYRIRQSVEDLVENLMVEVGGDVDGVTSESEYYKMSFEEGRDIYFERRLELRAFPHLTRLYSELNMSYKSVASSTGYGITTLGTTILLSQERESLVFETIKKLAVKYNSRIMDMDFSVIFNTTAWTTDCNASNSKNRQNYLAWETYKKDPNHYEDEFLIALECMTATIRRYEEQSEDEFSDGVKNNRPFIVVFRNLPQYISAMSSSYLAERVKSVQTPVFFIDIKIEYDQGSSLSHVNPSVMSLISSVTSASDEMLADADAEGDENYFTLTTTPLFDNYKQNRNFKSIYQTKSYKQIFGENPLIFNKPMNLQDGSVNGNSSGGVKPGFGSNIGVGGANNRDQSSANRGLTPTSVSFAFIMPNQQEASVIPSQLKSRQGTVNIDMPTKIMQMDMFLHYNMRNIVQFLNCYSIRLVDSNENSDVAEKVDLSFVWGKSDEDRSKIYNCTLSKLVYHRGRKMTADEIYAIVNNAITLQQIQSYKINTKLPLDCKSKKRLQLQSLYMSLEMSICALESSVLSDDDGDDGMGTVQGNSNNVYRLERSIIESYDRIFETFKNYFDELKTKRSEGCTSWRIKINKQDLTSAERHIYENYVQPSMISTTFEDIGSLDKAKDELESLMVPVKYPIFTQSNSLIRAPLGVLLYGPPGTGKTMLARALAKTANANFIHISSSKIVSKWLGESEGNAAAVFSLAKKMSPCIIFFDEVDGLLSVRENHEHESTRRVKNEFFSGWDGLLSCSNLTEKNLSVTVVAATNRPFDLDDAALRRLPHRVIIDLPDTQARYEILKKTLRGINLSSDIEFCQEKIKIDSEKNLSNIDKILYELASITEGYSGSDLRSVCTRAALQLVHDFMSDYKNFEVKSEQDILQLAKTYATKPLSSLEFKKALSEIGMSVDPKSKTFAEMRKWHETYGSKTTKNSLKRTSLGFY